MRFQRPGAVTAAAIMCIIHGSLSGLGGLCGVISLSAQAAMGDNFMGGGKDPVADAMKKELEAAPLYHVVEIAGPIVALALASALLVGGIGMLNMRRGARTLALAACVIAVTSTVVQTFYQIAYVIPAVSKGVQAGMPAAMRQQGNAPPPQDVKKAMEIMEFAMTIAAGVVAVVYALVVVYLLIIIFLLMRRHVRDAFAGVPALAGMEDEPFERDRSEDRRRDEYEEDDDWKSPLPPDDPKDDRFRPK